MTFQINNACLKTIFQTGIVYLKYLVNQLTNRMHYRDKTNLFFIYHFFRYIKTR